jgi:hypothetical protein
MDIGSDIIKFNAHIKLLVQGLAACGQTTNDLLIHLFTGYKAASDKEFVKYIKEKESLYEEGTDIGADALMEMAANKYKVLVIKDEWEAMMEEQKNIATLQTEVDSLKKQVKFKVKSPTKSPKQTNQAKGE